MSLTKIGSIGINTGIQFAGVTTVSTLHVGSGVTLSSDGDIFATGVSTFSGNLKVGSGVTISPDGDGFYTGVVTATTFSGALAASNLTGALPAISGANLTNLDASDLASGTVPTARLGSGTASSSTFLRGDSTFQTVNTDLVSDTSPQLGGNLDAGSHDIIFDDNSKLRLGNDNDLQIYHSGSSSWVYDNGTGDLNIASNGSTINMAVGASANYIAAKFISEGAAELYHNNERKIFTHATGIQVEDATSTAASIVMATSSGTSGSLYASGNNTLGLLDGQNHYMLKGVKDGALELYYDNSKKLETTETGAVVTGILTATTFVPSQGQLSNRNLVINGAMRVAQRGTSSTSEGYQTVDRFRTYTNGVDEAPTQSQEPLGSSSTGPYEKGFRNYFRIRNGNQTSGAGSADYIILRQKIEAQDVANSGWNYTSSSSFVTLSFWVRASVAQNYYFSILSSDGTLQNFPMETGSLTANTWTKITKTIPGASGVQFNNDAGIGIELDWWAFAGTDYTSNGVALNTWATFASGTRFPDHTSTWYTTNDATFDITGVQLEVGQNATPFEHRSFGEDLALCQRYFFKNINESGEDGCNYAKAFSTSELFTSQRFPVAMRAAPTITAYGNQGSAGTVHKLGQLPDKSYTSIDRQDRYGGFRFNSSGNWATGDTDMYSYTFQADAEL